MPAGKKFGGRKKGTPNKDKQQLLDMIREECGDKAYHPVVEMAKLVVALRDRTPDDDLSERDIKQLSLTANKEVAAYVAPKLKAVEVSGTGEDGSIHLTIKKFTVGAD